MKILLQGDSITDCGRNRDDITSMGNGYAAKVQQMYEICYPDKNITFVNKGISGNRVIDLLDRYEEDFVQVQPDIISILIGINDTWMKYDQNDVTTTEEFADRYRQLLQQISLDIPKAKILIIEPFLLNSLQSCEEWREDLNPKIMEVRKLAREYATAYLPLDGIMQQHIIGKYTDVELAEDSVHPTDIGHGIIAREYMKMLNRVTN